MVQLIIQETGLQLAALMAVGLLIIGVLCVIVILKDGDI